jgi:hypothetical protein
MRLIKFFLVIILFLSVSQKASAQEIQLFVFGFDGTELDSVKVSVVVNRKQHVVAYTDSDGKAEILFEGNGYIILSHPDYDEVPIITVTGRVLYYYFRLESLKL